MKIKYLGLILLVVAGLFASCAQTDFTEVTPKQLTDAERWKATHTIAELIKEFSTGATDYAVRSNSGNKNLFRVDTIRSGGAPVVISGRVVSSDIEGNVYKSIIIQEAKTGMGLKLSVDISSSSAVYSIGQLLNIKCNGLIIGKYGDVYQLGTLYYNDDSNPAKKGYEPGRIPYTLFNDQVQVDGFPEKDKIVIKEMTIKEIKASDTTIYSRLVRIKNINFTGYGEVNFKKVKLNASQSYFGLPKPDITGVPIAREITDGTGTMNIATSEFAKFASQPLPDVSMKGDITVIVGWYRDKATSSGSWQLTISSLNNLGAGFEQYLNKINYNN